MHVNVVVLDLLLIDTERIEMTFEIAHGRLGGLFHHVPKLTRQHETALARHAAELDGDQREDERQEQREQTPPRTTTGAGAAQYPALESPLGPPHDFSPSQPAAAAPAAARAAAAAFSCTKFDTNSETALFATEMTTVLAAELFATAGEAIVVPVLFATIGNNTGGVAVNHSAGTRAA